MDTDSKFDGWAILEIFGHQKYAGYVKTEYYGAACMFRCDVPPLPERERVTRSGARVQTDDPDVHTWAPPGSKVKAAATLGYTKLFGVGAIYSMTPCDQEAALKAVEELQPRPLMLVSLPVAQLMIDTYEGVPDEDEDEDGDGDMSDQCTGCGKSPELCSCEEMVQTG